MEGVKPYPLEPPPPLCKSLQSRSILHKTTTSQANPRPQISNKIYTYPGEARATRHKTRQHKHNTTSQSYTSDPTLQSNCILAPACQGHPLPVTLGRGAGDGGGEWGGWGVGDRRPHETIQDQQVHLGRNPRRNAPQQGCCLQFVPDHGGMVWVMSKTCCRAPANNCTLVGTPCST
jgi:hypothetical protein